MRARRTGVSGAEEKVPMRPCLGHESGTLGPIGMALVLSPRVADRTESR